MSEVENLLYSAVVINAVATRQAESMGQTPQGLIDQAQNAALTALGQPEIPERLAADVALKVLRRRFLERLPTSIDRNGTPATVTVDSPYPAIRSKIAELLAAGDLDGLVRLVPIRNTKLREQVAMALLFRKAAHYEAAARERIRQDVALAAKVRVLVGSLP